MHSDIPSHILFGFPRAHGANAKRIKSMGAKGWRGKLGGDTWGPTILSLPVLPTGLKKHVRFNMGGVTWLKKKGERKRYHSVIYYVCILYDW